MRSGPARAALAIAAIALVVVLFVVLSSDDSDDSSSVPATTQQQSGDTGGTVTSGATADGKPSQTKPQSKPPVTIVVRNGKPVGGVKRLEYEKGEHVRFVVRSDVSDEIHVHGYDRNNLVNAGGTARFDFKANLEGVFEIELESRGEQIAELRVTPS